MKKIVITGANGLLGWHSCVRLHAANCAAAFNGETLPYEVIAVGHADFDDDQRLGSAVRGADAVLHFAGVNRGDDHVVEAANPDIAERMVRACHSEGSMPHVVYANSTHAAKDTAYGRSKRLAGQKFVEGGFKYCDIVLPHIFGECAKPYYNNVTATLIVTGRTGMVEPESTRLSVPDLHYALKEFHRLYQENIYPAFDSAFSLQLFNSYRSALYPQTWPRSLQLHADQRGVLFEAVKGGSGGQTFMSRTKSGVTRGDHFHLNKVERFLVIQGEAVIRLRKVFDDVVTEFSVDGDNPQIVDMPTMHSHSIENVGHQELITLFWVHEIFDPENPDTFAEPVLQ